MINPEALGSCLSAHPPELAPVRREPGRVAQGHSICSRHGSWQPGGRPVGCFPLALPPVPLGGGPSILQKSLCTVSLALTCCPSVQSSTESSTNWKTLLPLAPQLFPCYCQVLSIVINTKPPVTSWPLPVLSRRGADQPSPQDAHSASCPSPSGIIAPSKPFSRSLASAQPRTTASTYDAALLSFATNIGSPAFPHDPAEDCQTSTIPQDIEPVKPFESSPRVELTDALPVPSFKYSVQGSEWFDYTKSPHEAKTPWPDRPSSQPHPWLVLSELGAG